MKICDGIVRIHRVIVVGDFIFNTNLSFLYNIDIEGFKKSQQIIMLPPVGFELTTLTTTGLVLILMPYPLSQSTIHFQT